MRLDRYLAEAGLGTRKEVKELLKKGQVTVNGLVVKEAKRQVTEDDQVAYGGESILYQEFYYLMLHKPAGVVSATSDTQKTVIDLIPNAPKGLFPVGRLDKDTEGLLLLTNDGQLAHDLLAPKKHVAKRYYAEIKGLVTEEDRAAFQAGIHLKEGLLQPANLTILSTDQVAGMSRVEIEIQEGKFHQIKRMFHAVAKEVTYLKRLTMGPLSLDPSLAKGAYRSLTTAETAQLLALKKDDPAD